MAPEPAQTRGRYIDPRTLMKIRSLELRARVVVQGFWNGLHRSPYKGFSVEFSEYRQYMPGDDLSTIDWKVYGRSDRFYVKKYEEETNLDCRILLDVSGSMSYRSDGVTKREYGAYLAASLAYLMHRQRDAVGLVTFDDAIIANVPVSARPGHLTRILVTLDQTVERLRAATLGLTGESQIVLPGLLTQARTSLDACMCHAFHQYP